jgi:hypothetical protein
MAIGAKRKTVPVVRAFFHAFVLAVACATYMPDPTVVFVQINLIQRVKAHAQNKRISRSRDRVLTRWVVVVNAKPDPGDTPLESHPKVSRKRRERRLGNFVYRGLILRFMEISALDVVAGKRGPCKRLQQ